MEIKVWEFSVISIKQTHSNFGFASKLSCRKSHNIIPSIRCVYMTRALAELLLQCAVSFVMFFQQQFVLSRFQKANGLL